MEPRPNPLLLDAINQRIEIQLYDAEWPGRFAIECTRLLYLFPETFLGIEHFGSTAVPGLAAKPVIDILAGIASMHIADELLSPLCRAGYDTSKEFNDTLKNRRWLMLHQNGKRTHHLHLVIFGQTDWQRNLAFRDALRADRELALRYQTLKRNLAAQHPDDREAYTAAKSEFIMSVIGA
ncbi:MAG TPA: GrpB family protein [Phycisphaerae bacterium]|nr:GrpB family protein [Phycisphaerae bacterium]